MRIEDIKINGYYYMFVCSAPYLVKIKCRNGNNFSDLISINMRSEYTVIDAGSTDYGDMKNLRNATVQEVLHLEACLEAGRYVEDPHIGDNVWYKNIKTGDVLTCKTEPGIQPDSSGDLLCKSGGHGFEAGLTFEVAYVTTCTTNCGFTYPIIFRKNGGNGIYHPSIDQHSYKEIELEVFPVHKPIEDVKKGDYVVLPKERPRDWNDEGDMDKFLNKVVKITSYCDSHFTFESCRGWHFKPKEIIRYATSIEAGLCQSNSDNPVEVPHSMTPSYMTGGSMPSAHAHMHYFPSMEKYTASKTSNTKYFEKEKEISLEELVKSVT